MAEIDQTKLDDLERIVTDLNEIVAELVAKHGIPPTNCNETERKYHGRNPAPSPQESGR